MGGLGMTGGAVSDSYSAVYLVAVNAVEPLGIVSAFFKAVGRLAVALAASRGG